MATGDNWYCIVMGQQFGPLPSQELLRMVRHQYLKPDDMVRRGESGDWVPAHQIGQLVEKG